MRTGSSVSEIRDRLLNNLSLESLVVLNAASTNSSPTSRLAETFQPPSSRIALLTMASNTGWTSVGEASITLKISAVAACWARASASCCSTSRTLAPSFLGDLRVTGGLASLDFAGFGPDPSVSLAFAKSAGDRLGEGVRVGKGEFMTSESSSQSFSSGSAFSSQYVIPISRYIAVAVVRCSCACSRLPVRR
jgi:hypothetical protein